jgi:serine/threonine protein phosphatase PrpC
MTETSSVLEWGVATLTLAGESESGDLHLVREVGGGVLVAVVDGLGHGEEAAAAAKLAVTTLDRFAREPVASLVQRCHEALFGTRGVVMSVAFFDPDRDTMTWIGLGNVEGVLVHENWAERSSRTSLVTRGGIVGSKGDRSPVRPWVIPVQQRDLLVFATDGIRGGFAEDISRSDTPQQVADLLLARYGKGTDDALVLAARYLGRR